MSKFETMDYIVSAVVLCYGIYLMIQNVRLFIANQKVRKEYLRNHKDGYTMVNQYVPATLFFLLLAAIGIIGVLVAEKTTKNDQYTCIALVMLSIVCVGMALDSFVKRRAIVDKDGFVFEKAHYRFRSILTMQPTKSFVKNIDILTNEQQHVIVSKKMGAYLQDSYQKWKKRKKK